ncbi:RDD family protein [Microbacterium lacus]|uniref:RDD family protein n=1 Tax=Microbacterium lacus TaxID=415217 RepID=UPI00384C240E
MTDPTLAITDTEGDASPDMAKSLGMVPASLGFRSLAFAIDLTIWLVLVAPAAAGVIVLVSGAEALLATILLISGVVLSTVFGLVQLITHGRRGVTAGKAALRLRSISAADYGRPGFWRIVLRVLVLWASNIVPIVGPAVLFSSSLWDPQHRGRSILDRVAGCWVIDARAGLDPFDAKALRHAHRALRDKPDDSEDLPSMATGADPAVALRIPGARSRAGVVGSGSGAQWSGPQAPIDVSVIEEVPGTPSTAVPLAGPPNERTTIAAAPASAGVEAPAAGPIAAAPSSVAPAGATRRSAQMIRFDDGSVIRVPALGLMGREPEAAPGENADALIRLDDPQVLMSKTHIAFGADAEGLWVADRGSRNGTRLVSPQGYVVDVVVGESTQVPQGWTVQVGGRSFEVVARGAQS